MRRFPNEKYIKRPAIYFGLIVIPFILFYSIISLYHKFDLKTVIIISPQNNIKGLNTLNKANLLILNPTQVSSILIKQNPSLQTISIIKKYPGTLVLGVENRFPVAYFLRSKNNLFIDKEGIIFTSNQNDQNLPAIDVSEISVYEGQKADWKIQKAITFIEEFIKQSIIIDQFSIDDLSNSFRIKLANGIEILLPFNSDAYIKASSLQAIVLRFKIIGKNISNVDFRFDKPVVTLSNGEKISSILQ